MWRNVSVWDIDSSMAVKTPSFCYWIVIGLSAGASNFTNGAINTHNRISGTIRMPIKNSCASKRRGGRAREVKRVTVILEVKVKSDGGKERKSACMWVSESRRREMVAHSSFLCHKLSWAFTCSVSNLSVIWGPGLIQSVCSSSVQTQSFTLTCNPFAHHHHTALGIMKHT